MQERQRPLMVAVADRANDDWDDVRQREAEALAEVGVAKRRIALTLPLHSEIRAHLLHSADRYLRASAEELQLHLQLAN